MGGKGTGAIGQGYAPCSFCFCSLTCAMDFGSSMLGAEGLRVQDGAGQLSVSLAVVYQLPDPHHHKPQPRGPAARVSELWSEEGRPGPLLHQSHPRAPPLHTPACSQGPGHHLSVRHGHSCFSRPLGMSVTNEMEASARQAWGQQGWRLRSKSSRTWHPSCFLFQGPAGQTSTGGQWRDS